jgi:putative salt-induced outer membrane protein YdiY
VSRYFVFILLAVSSGAAFGADDDEKPFRAAAALSYHGTGGNTSTHGLMTGGDSEYAYGKFMFDGGGDYSFAASGGERKAERTSLFAGAKFFFTGGDRLYARYKARWLRNTFAGFDYRLSNFAGLGVYVFREKSKQCAAGALLGYIRESYVAEVGEPPAGFPAVCVGFDCKIPFGDIYEFDASVTWDVSLEDAADRVLTADLRFGVVAEDWLVLTIGEQVEWDNVTPEGYAQQDLVTNVGLAIRTP